jgi:hypothetical protein
MRPMRKVTGDFDFLRGDFDVVSRRLDTALGAGGQWHETRATSKAFTAFEGAVSIDEMTFPEDGFQGMSIRLFDPLDRTWSVHWVHSARGRLQPPVRGRWTGSGCWLTGEDTYDGRPVLASYAWSAITADSAHWEQCFSTDGGATWKPNWTMDFRRRLAPRPPQRPHLRVDDFAFLEGRWRVRHRRLRERLRGSSDWQEATSEQAGRLLFGGAASIDEVDLLDPGHRGLAIRLHDPLARLWSIYWVDSQDGRLQPPVQGGFSDGTGVFYADELLRGRRIRVRFIWDGITADGAHWVQACSPDHGVTWEDNWHMHLTRPDGGSSR